MTSENSRYIFVIGHLSMTPGVKMGIVLCHNIKESSPEQCGMYTGEEIYGLFELDDVE